MTLDTVVVSPEEVDVLGAASAVVDNGVSPSVRLLRSRFDLKCSRCVLRPRGRLVRRLTSPPRVKKMGRRRPGDPGAGAGVDLPRRADQVGAVLGRQS